MPKNREQEGTIMKPPNPKALIHVKLSPTRPRGMPRSSLTCRQSELLRRRSTQVNGAVGCILDNV
jgi:hypothetical protein